MNNRKVGLEKIKRISNIELQLLQCIYGDNLRSVVEMYINGEIGWHVHFSIGSNRFCATWMKGLDVSDNSIGCGKSSVLIGIREVSDELRPLASIVRLQKLNVCPMFSADTFEPGIPLTPKILWAILDKKLRMVYNRAGIEACNLIDQIVKGSPEIVNDFTNQDFNDRRNRMRRDSLDGDWFLSTLDLLQQFKIIIIDSSVYCDLPEDVYSAIQIGQMFTSPFNPLISAIQRLHKLYYPQGEDYGRKETKDSEGARDTRAPKGRVRTQSKKGSQVNVPKSEEVGTQTLPDLHPGDCNAKHTHLGSLEDV